MKKNLKNQKSAVFSYWIVFLLLSLSLFPSSSPGADNSVCARVKIEIRQELTFERQAFDAHMAINNGLTNISLENVRIDVTFADKDGNSVLASSDPNSTNALFFIRTDTLENITDINGSGRVGPSSTADIHWLIIPAPGASNGLEQGTLYYVGATLRYTIGEQANVTEVSPDYIYVKPMPELALDYFLPSDVYGDDPMTPEIEPVIPFSLGVRVRNNGEGTARALKIDSAQPKIVDNQQGLLVGFTILGSEVNGQPATNSLLANFGDIKPNASGTARWTMTASLSGKFVEFKASYSHADALGGELTSLIDSANTHFLVHDVLVDLPGRDAIKDFLAKDGDVYRVYESEGVDTGASNQSASSALQLLSQSGPQATYSLSVPSTTGFLYVQLTDPFAGQKIIQEVVRSDGKRIKADNAWLSKTRYRSDPWQYFFNLFDANTANSYTVVFTDPAAGPQPPVLQFIADRTRAEGQQLSFIVQASDPDGTVPVQSASPLPALARFTDQGNGTATFDWTPATGQAGRYEITFAASEGSLKTSQRAVMTITNTPTGNNPPLVPSSPSPANGAPNIAVNTHLTWVGGDPDQGDTVTYDVYLGTANPPTVKVSADQSGTSYSTSALPSGTTHYWKIVARDNHGAETAGPVWHFTTVTTNNPPVANAGADQNVTTGHPVTLNGSGSYDPEGLQITYLWTFVSVPAGSGVTNGSLSNATNARPAFTPDVNGVYRLRLIVNDGTQNSAPSEVVITANSSNPPVADAGRDQNALTGQPVTLNGTESHDPEGAMITFHWTFAAVPAGSGVTNSSLSDATSAKPAFTPDVNGAYRVQLIVNDGSVDSAPDEVTIQASASNVPPNANAGPDRNGLTGSAVELDGSRSSDPDNGPQPLTYLWSFVSKPTASLLGDNDITEKNTPDAGFIPDVNGTYVLKLTISDGNLSSEDTVQIIAASADVPPNADAGADMTASLGETAALDASASSDPDHGPQPLTYLWSFVAVPAGSQLANGNISGADTVSPSFIPDVVGTYVLRLRAFDGTHTEFDNVAVTVIQASGIVITATAGPGGAISPAGPVTVSHGGSQTFTITPNGGYHILDVKVDGQSVGAVASYTFDDVTSAHTIEASFAMTQYTITATAGPGGLISPSGPVAVNSGGNQSFTITPNTGYRLSDVRVDGVSVGAVPSYSFSNVISDHTIDASFAAIQYTITATAGENGAISPSGPVTVNYGGSQAFTITPNEGYHVADVKADGASVGVVTSYTFSSVTSDHTIEASFGINQYTLTAQAGPNGAFSPSGPVTVNHGGSQVFTITPDEGFYLADVKVDGSSVGALTSYTFTNVTMGHTIEASFAINQYAFTAQAGPNGAISPSGSIMVNHGGSQTFTIAPNTGYHVADVKVDGVSAGAVTTYTFNNVTAGHTIEASFAINQYTLTATAGPNGAISPSGSVMVNHGGSQTFTIAPNTGYHVADVKVDGASAGAMTTYTFNNVIAGHTIEASFAINQYTLTARAGQHGTISPSGSVIVNHGGSQTFTITPNDGYHVADVWVDGISVDAVSAYTFIEIAGDHTIQAGFAQGLYSLDLPRTGQIVKEAPGDDGSVRAGILWPIPRFTAAADTTLTDNLTGLVWPPDAGTPTIGTCAGSPMTWQGALDYIACLNASNYLGHNDWRVPNLNELESLIHADEADGSQWLTSQGFSNVAAAYYWSSSTLYSSPNEAWAVHLHQGDVTYGSKDSSNPVLAVRGMTSDPAPALLWRTGQTTSYATSDDGNLREGIAWPGPRFATNGDATLTDELTGLAWPHNAGTPTFGTCAGGTKTWQNGLDYVACLNTHNYLGHNDWRLPNRKELRSLIHYGQGNIAAWLDTQGFVNVKSNEYWSSTTYAASQESAWSLDMVSGEMAGSTKDTASYVLPVRAGTIIQNIAPHVTSTGGGVYEVNSSVSLGGQVSDFDGDLLAWEWLEGSQVLSSGQIETIYGGDPVALPGQTVHLGLGTHTVSLRVSDGVNQPVTGDLNIQIVDTAAPTTTASPAGGTYASAQYVTLACIDGTGSGCDKIYYTTDGTTPTPLSPVYSGSPIYISATTTLKFFAKDVAGNSETVKSQTYTITTGAPTVTIQLKDSAGNPLSGGVVQYYSGGWQAFGTTDVSGQASKDLPAGTYSFSMTYAFGRQEKSQNITLNPTVVFQTTRVAVQLKDSTGTLIDTGTAQYYSGGWHDIGSTSGGQIGVELLPGSYSFSMTYAYVRQEKSQNVTSDPTVIFHTTRVAVQLKDSTGAPIDTGTVQYYSGGWRDIGSTSGGQITKELLPGSYSFSMTYAYARQEKSQNVGTDPTVIFQTTRVAIQLKDSTGALIDTGAVQYCSGGWRDIGSTSGGQVGVELLPGSYSFSMTYAFARQEKSQNIGTNPTVVFQTTRVTVQLKDSTGALIDTGTVQYYSGGWRDIGSTSGGQVTKELLPGSYSFSMTYAFARQEKSQNVGTDPTVVFQTTRVTAQLKDSTATLIDTGAVQYYSGGWRDIGSTSGGQVTKELLPGSYSFSMTYAFARQEKSQNVAVDPTVIFQTTKVTIQLKDSTGTLIDTGTVQYYSGGWRDIGSTSGGQVSKELLPGSYSFSMTYAFARQEKSQNIAVDPTVVFQTGKIHSDSGSCTGYYAGGWRVFIQDTELLPVPYTFRFNDGTADTSYTIASGALIHIH